VSESRDLGRASVLLASGTMVSRVLGFVKAIVVVAVLGQYQSAVGNAYALANQLPNNIFALIAGGMLSAVLVPQIVKATTNAADGGQAFVNKLITLGGTVVGVLGLAATIAAPLLVQVYATTTDEAGAGFGPATTSLAIAFAWWCLPQVFFYGLYTLLGEVLNARGAFGPFTWAPVVNNVVAIAGLGVVALMLGGADASDPANWDAGLIAVLGGTTTLGVAVQALVLVAFWGRTGLRFRLDFGWRGVGLGGAGRAALWVFGGVLVNQGSGIVQARVLTLGNDAGASTATWQSAWLVFILPHSVVTISIAMAYFTRMSQHASTNAIAPLRADLSSALRSVGVFIVFAAVAMSVLSFPISRVFEAGFDPVSSMAWVLVAQLVGLVPISAQYVMQRAFFATEDTRTPFFIILVQASVFLVGAAVVAFTVPVEWIAVGVALALSFACTVQMLLTIVWLRRRIGGRGLLVVRRHLVFLVGALVAGAAGLGVVALLGGYTAGGFALDSRATAIVTCVVGGVVMAVVYAVVLRLARNPEADAVLAPVLRRLRRG
jgi:putative peptidoglycan lipid II flippase